MHITKTCDLSMAINRDFGALKIENLQLKTFDSFHIFAQNIDCGLGQNKTNRYIPAYPSFAI